MSYEMTQFDPSRQPDFWSEVPATHGGGPAAPRNGGAPVTPMERIRRLLRGRTTLAAALALAGGLIGASLGWASQQKQYQATGSVRIEPYQPTDGGKTEAMPGYRQFMNSELQVVEGLPIATEAMQQEVWKQMGQEWTPAAFADCVNARYTAETSYMHVSFSHGEPRFAEAGASAAIQAYEQYFLRRKADTDSQTLESLRRRLTDLGGEIVAHKAQITEDAKVYGGIENLTGTRAKLENDDTVTRADVREVERDLQAAVETRDRVLSSAPLSIEELALGDLELAMRLHEIEMYKRERDRQITLQRGLNHPQVRSLNSLIAQAEIDIQPMAQRVREVYYGQIPNPAATAPNSTIALTAVYITSLEQRRDRLLSDQMRIEQSLARVVADDRKFNELDALIAGKTQQMRETEQRISDQQRNSEFQQQLANISVSLPPAGSAYVSQDRRKHMALAGAVFGFGAPLGAIMLIGLLDRRFRYSEDAAEAGDRATLLGILPNLPDRLSDPNQASIAAHCVHQIRTMLQINHGSAESRAFAITSASRGDGKTSLALALGLSYAASGARTLLIDTDLQHGGLSTRLGVNSDEGTMDALARGELLQYVCETDVTDLAILPIGRAAANHAGAFSPAAVKHMLDMAKRHFDVIICDTGPILGSIEATPVASAVDGVVLAVSRGQSRPLVSKALKHLESVGAIIAGLVFNRAQAADFERSVSGMNLRNGSTRMPARGALPNGSLLSQN